MASLAFVAHDGETLTFELPRKVNKYLVTRAIQRLHRGDESELVGFGLTRAETEFVAEVVARLEERKRRAEAV